MQFKHCVTIKLHLQLKGAFKECKYCSYQYNKYKIKTRSRIIIQIFFKIFAKMPYTMLGVQITGTDYTAPVYSSIDHYCTSPT